MPQLNRRWHFRCWWSFFALALVLSGGCPPTSHASDYDTDFFSEDRREAGLRLGGVVSGYTAYERRSAIVSVQSQVRWLTGASINFVYSAFVWGVELLYYSRTNINLDKFAHAVALPVLFRGRLDIEKDIYMEAGGGVQAEYVFDAKQDHRLWHLSPVALVALKVEDQKRVYVLESRFLYGVRGIFRDYSQSLARDFSFILGVDWVFE